MNRLVDLVDAASITQMVLRALGLVCGGTALALAAGTGAWGWQWPFTLVGAGFLVWATARPDAEAGLGLCCCVVLNATAGHPTLTTAAVIGIALLAAHLLWSACAMTPAHGSPGPRLLGLMALVGAGLTAASVLVDLVIVALPRVGAGAGLMVLAVAVISLTVVAIVLLADRTQMPWQGRREG